MTWYSLIAWFALVPVTIVIVVLAVSGHLH
jgi:hypothetical protein